MTVLSYQTPVGARPVLATVLLWLWAILDVCAGVLLVFIGWVLLRDDILPTQLRYSGLYLWIIGVGLACWGAWAGVLAVKVYRLADNAAANATRACRWAMYAWSGLVLFVIGALLAGSSYDFAGICFLLSILWFVFFCGILLTYFHLKNIRDREIKRQSAQITALPT